MIIADCPRGDGLATAALTKSVKYVAELEAAVSSKPNPNSVTASQYQLNNNSTVHYKYTCSFCYTAAKNMGF